MRAKELGGRAGGEGMTKIFGLKDVTRQSAYPSAPLGTRERNLRSYRCHGFVSLGSKEVAVTGLSSRKTVRDAKAASRDEEERLGEDELR